MRDAARMREKIELQLDTRQVVGLVVGAAVVLGIVFYLGVGVGRHLGPAVPAEKTDPLAALDERAEVQAALTFPEELTEPAKPSPAAPPVAAPVEAAKPAPVPPEADIPAAGRGASPAEPAAVAPEAPAPGPAAAPAPAPEPARLPSAEEALAAHDARVRSGSGTTAPAASAPAAPAAETFTVQAASMPTREEAEAFAAKLRAKGLPTQVIEADIPGKGRYYRVRLGRFSTREAADRYLQDFKRETGLTGYVTTTGK